jgi:hypothetical protein
MKPIIDLFKKATVSTDDFTSFWNLIGINEGLIYAHNPFTITAIIDFPMAFMKDPEIWAHEMNLISTSFTSAPPNTTLNTYLLKYFETPNIQGAQISKWPLLNYLEAKRINQFNAKSSPQYDTFIAITVPVDIKHRRVETPISKWYEKKMYEMGLAKSIRQSPLNDVLTDHKYFREFKEAKTSLESICDQIRTRFNGQSFRLETEQVHAFLSRVFNHTAHRPISSLQSIFSSDVFADPDNGHLEYGNHFHATVSARTKDLPTDIDETFNWLYYDQSLLNVPFNVQTTTRFPAYDKALTQAQKVVSRCDAGAALPFLRRKMEAIKARMELALEAVFHSNGRIVDVAYTVSTWAKTKDQLESNINAVRNCLRSKNMGTSRDTFNAKIAWNCQAPWLSHRNVITTRLPSMNAEVMNPLLYPPTYYNKKPPEYPNWYHTKYQQVTCFDSFDPNCNNWNGVVVGASGSGKSFNLNKIAIDATTFNSRLFIIDKGGPGGGSFRNLVFNLKGTYIELDFQGEQQFSINPFDGALFYKVEDTGEIDPEGDPVKAYTPSLEGSVNPDKVMALTNFLTLLVQNYESSDKGLHKFEDALLQSLLEEAYREHENNLKNSLTISIFANEYLLKYFESPKRIGILTEQDVQKTCGHFFRQLDKFINNGIYSRFFTYTKDLSEQDVFCFDLEGVDAHPDLKTILTSVIIQYCSNLCMDGHPERKKLIVIDEAWALLGGGKMTSMIEMIWRTIRKHGGRIYCATQDFETIMTSPAGLAIMGNSSYFYFMGSKFKWETVRQVEASGKNGVLNLTPWDFEGIREQKFDKGNFAEFYLMTPTFKGTLRLYPSSYDYQLATTDAADKARQNVIKAKHGVDFITEAVLEELVRR